jgi:hypothetical protein
MDRFFKKILNIQTNNVKYLKEIDVGAIVSEVSTNDEVVNKSSVTHVDMENDKSLSEVNNLSEVAKQSSIIKRKLFQSRAFINQAFFNVSKNNVDDTRINNSPEDNRTQSPQMGNFETLKLFC